MHKFEKEVYTPKKEILKIQEERFRKTVKHAMNCSFYRKRLKELGINGVNDLEKIPLTTKEDLRKAYPLEMSCVNKSEIVRIQMSGGTTGSPVIIPYTRGDVEQWKEMLLRAFFLAGIGKKDVIQITPAFGLWNGGFGFHFAADAIDAFTIPIGAGNTRNQLKFMRDFGTTVLCSTASYPLRIAEVAERMGIDVAELPLEKMLLGAEPWSEEMRKKIEEIFDVKAFDIPGLTEMGGVGTVGFECPERNGIHIWEDNYIVEIVDPETGERVDDGEEGEVVYTSINREAMPLLRYRSGEISAIVSRERCECGIEHLTIKRIRGRTDDMVIYRGVKFYPSDVESILYSHGIVNYKIEAGERIKIIFEGESAIIERILADIKEFLGFKPEIEAVATGTLERFEGKARRLVRV
ncbi:MAG: phenylacetate--CoA ligase family protein [Archaeoglobus sp.]|nr:phenylacetate--CoA ligase family protein [Archaeoglobus sp.]